MDLKFPHHECEIAQSVGASGKDPVKYWLHSNMLTVNGQKMSKSLGNSFLPDELFNGTHDMLDQAFSPMTVRFFMLQSHYSSTLDFSNEALKAAAKGYKKLVNGLNVAKGLTFVDEAVDPDEKSVKNIESIIANCYRAMNDDFNTAQTIAQLFNLLKKINSISTGNLKPAQLGADTFNKLIDTYIVFVEDVLGLKEEEPSDIKGILKIILDLYLDAKGKKEYEKVDEIRSKLKEYGITLKDMKSEVGWAYEES